MTKTIDDIKEMNLKVGDKIEISFEEPGITRKKISYFSEIDEKKCALICGEKMIQHVQGDPYCSNEKRVYIPHIKDIKKLQYKK